jgi:long-chain acyl-CoA synthetase
MTIGSVLAASAALNSQKTAITLREESISYQELDQSVTILAQWFVQQGYQRGDRVALLWPNSIELVMLFLACFRAGLIAVPVNVRLKSNEVAYVLQHSRAVLSFVHPDLASVAEEASRGCVSIARMHTMPAISDEDVDATALPIVVDDDPALIVYTSGTTARPKGVTHSHRSLMENVRQMYKASPDSLQTIVSMTQMAFITSMCAGLLLSVATGATLVLMQAFDAPLALDLIERFRCTYSFGLPVMIQCLIEEQTRRPRDVSSLRTFLAGGDSVPTSTQEEFRALFGIALREGHGMTEIGAAIFNPAKVIRPGSLGKPLEDVHARLVGADGKDVQDGAIGELLLRSPSMFTGYWDDPAATAEAVTNGWMRSGDLCRRDPEGYYWFEGRKKEIIVRGGSNISPQEVEEAIYAHPAVAEVGVVGAPDGIYGERLIAFVSLRSGAVAREHELKEYARRRLADHKVPGSFVFLERLPKGPTGKIQRRALKGSHRAAR